MVELAFVCYITRCQSGQKRGEFGIQSVPQQSQSMSSSQSSIGGGTYNNSMAFGCLSSRDLAVTGQTVGSLRYRPHPLANGVCGGGRGALATAESARGSLLCHERKTTNASNRRTSQSQSFHGGNGSISAGNYRRQQSSPSPPPQNSRLLRNGSPPTNTGSAYEMNSMLGQPTPLTFEQVTNLLIYHSFFINV